MAYEIEKRALFSSKAEFEACEKQVAKISRPANIFIYKTFLYRKPEYLRIRIIKGKPDAEVTIKSGSYKDAARKETNEYIPLPKLPDFVNRMKKKGYTECVSIMTESHKYILDGLEVAFNNIEHLGLIVEVEALTEDKKQVTSLEKKIKRMMKKLGLIELGANEYQRMMNKMYETALNPVEQQKFSL